jgi:hypothetical protein
MLEHHVSHLTVAASTEFERVVDKAEAIALRVPPILIDPHTHPLALVTSPAQVDRMKMIRAAPLPLPDSGDDSRRLQSMIPAHHDSQAAIERPPPLRRRRIVELTGLSDRDERDCAMHTLQ